MSKSLSNWLPGVGNMIKFCASGRVFFFFFIKNARMTTFKENNDNHVKKQNYVLIKVSHSIK